VEPSDGLRVLKKEGLAFSFLSGIVEEDASQSPPYVCVGALADRDGDGILHTEGPELTGHPFHSQILSSLDLSMKPELLPVPEGI
jgi:hypothetical protein